MSNYFVRGNTLTISSIGVSSSSNAGPSGPQGAQGIQGIQGIQGTTGSTGTPYFQGGLFTGSSATSLSTSGTAVQVSLDTAELNEMVFGFSSNTVTTPSLNADYAITGQLWFPTSNTSGVRMAQLKINDVEVATSFSPPIYTSTTQPYVPVMVTWFGRINASTTIKLFGAYYGTGTTTVSGTPKPRLTISAIGTGPQGSQGVQGIQGIQGIQGLQGITGPSGTGTVQFATYDQIPTP
jgi:hypothetical protein